MEDHLKELCTNANLELIYTNNKFTLLSSGTENNSPSIRAHKIFRNCNNDVAHAIVGFYTSYGSNKSYIEIIESFLKEYYPDKQYKIKPPSEMFKVLLAQNYYDDNFYTDNEISIQKMSTLSISKKNFNANESDISSDKYSQNSHYDSIDIDTILNSFNT